MSAFSSQSASLTQALNVFVSNSASLTQPLNNMPKSMTMTGTVNAVVTLNGAEVLGKLAPGIEQMVTDKVNQVVGRVFKDKMPDAGPVEVN